MSTIVWDKVGDRTYQTGVDRGVLYLPDGSGVPWNGLTSIAETPNRESNPVYFDGKKINDLVTLSDFVGSMKAITYPEEFLEFEGIASLRDGLHYADQRVKCFNLSYRTLIGSDVNDGLGYKLHILYNVTAVAKDKEYATLNEETSLTEFEWDITAVPEEIPGFYPTAHIIVDSRNVHPLLLQDIEKMLYGDDDSEASLTPMADLVTYLATWFLIKITDNGDGTWTAEAPHPGYIEFVDGDPTQFRILHANATYLDADTYEISDTVDFLEGEGP